jgi:hypothetical protein
VFDIRQKTEKKQNPHPTQADHIQPATDDKSGNRARADTSTGQKC